MRELKFRAWDKEYSRYDDFNTIKIGENGVVFDKDYDWQEEIWYDKPDKEHNFVIEQYTGLKDKNGKEIYEGDIIKARWRRAKHTKLDTQGEVKFGNGWFYIDDDPDGRDRLGVPIHNCYNVEIIGNIHENPELLGGEK